MRAFAVYIGKKTKRALSCVSSDTGMLLFFEFDIRTIAGRVSNCFHFVMTRNFEEAFFPNVRRCASR